MNELASSVASTSKCSRPPSWPIAAVPCEMQSVWRNAAVRVKTSALNFGLPALAGVNQQFQTASINVEDGKSEATKRLPARWTREEEWYNFRTNPRDTVHVLLSVDESTYDPRGYSVPGGSPPMGDHPISWCQPYDGGRSFYTALGHKGVYWDEPDLLRHVLGGIRMAAGVTRFNCG